MSAQQPARRRPAATDHGHDHKPVNWFAGLDALVWACIALLVVLAVEYLVGHFVREKLAREADAFRAKVNARRNPTESADNEPD